MNLIGGLLVAVGAILLAGGLGIGAPFTAVFLMGFIGTSGREAGGELALMLGLTLTAVGVAVLLIKIGKGLRR